MHLPDHLATPWIRPLGERLLDLAELPNPISHDLGPLLEIPGRLAIHQHIDGGRMRGGSIGGDRVGRDPLALLDRQLESQRQLVVSVLVGDSPDNAVSALERGG